MIGPAALLLTTTQTTCVYASHDTELYMCTKELLIEALNEFPDIHRRLHRQALHEQAEVDAASAGQDAKDAPRAPWQPAGKAGGRKGREKGGRTGGR